jgi:hypothetical protein
MKHLKKFNEDMESNELGYKLIGPIDPEEVEGEIQIGDSFKNYSFAKLPDGSELKGGYDEGHHEYVLVVKNGIIEVAIYEYEIMNPFVFGDIIIVSGHDSITCYNFVTGEQKTVDIR